MKKHYNAPNADVILLDSADVIRTSFDSLEPDWEEEEENGGNG